MGSLGKSMADDDDIMSSINIVPFVDIVLVLLIIFMLTSAAIAKASIEVKLPRAASAGSKVDSTLNFVYTAEGTLEVDGKPMSLAEAARLVRREVKANPKVQAVISADKAVDYGLVIDLIDLVKLNGVSDFALDVERKAKAPSP
jgi:biopolymer transport protein ExbD